MSVQGQLGLLRLVSPALPVGAFSYSRGLEGAVLCRLQRAFVADDTGEVAKWSAFLRASRESAELLLEDAHMGRALARLLQSLGQYPAWLDPAAQPSFAAMFALAAVRWEVSERDALAGFLWSVTEGQVSAALRLLPLGHTAGQRILARALPVIERCAATAAAIDDDAIGNFSSGLALASAWHETLYSRLVRS